MLCNGGDEVQEPGASTTLEAIDDRLVDDRPTARDALEEVREPSDKILEAAVQRPMPRGPRHLDRHGRHGRANAEVQGLEELRQYLDGHQAAELGLEPPHGDAGFLALPIPALVACEQSVQVPRGASDGAQALGDGCRADIPRRLPER